jgi:hypothetical protein
VQGSAALFHDTFITHCTFMVEHHRSPRFCRPQQNKALRERLHAAQAAAEENERLKADMRQLCQQMVGAGRPASMAR